MDAWGAEALARAVPRARATEPAEIKQAVVHASAFTWARTATRVRETLASCIG
jgi:hypothetical protein